MGGIWECREVGRGGGKATDINSRGKLLGGGLLPRGEGDYRNVGKGIKDYYSKKFSKENYICNIKGTVKEK